MLVCFHAFRCKTSWAASLLYSLRWCKVLCKWPSARRKPPGEIHPPATTHRPPTTAKLFPVFLAGWSCMRMQQTAFLLLAILAMATPILKEPKWPKRREQLLRFRFHIWEFGFSALSRNCPLKWGRRLPAAKAGAPRIAKKKS